MKFSRRTLLAAGTALPLAACAKLPAPVVFSQTPSAAQANFAHGIASGDMTASGAIVWTRVTAALDGSARPVNWELSSDSRFETLIQAGEVQASAATDYTVKIDVQNLEAGALYNYRFKDASALSPVGNFKTLPNGSIDSLHFAVVSCTNWEAGFFNVYDHIARNGDFDAVLHLGDYYYEYGTDGWGGDAGAALGRVHEPAHEIISLSDYRIRHAQYRSDASLQAMTAAHPMICMWDDHETANDSWETGAQNHNDGEGVWSERKAAAMQAYYEWMPVREPKDRALHSRYASYSFGDLLTLVTTETRLTARAEPINIDLYTKDMNGPEDAQRFTNDVLNAPDREMHGSAQVDFIVEALSQSKASGQPWRLLGNQVVMGKLHTADMTPHVVEESIVALEKDWPGVRDFVRNSAFGLPIYPDSWDGYPWAREQFYKRLQSAGVTDLVVVTGDAHEFWANDLTSDDGTKMGVELGTTSVTSPTLVSYFGDATADYSLLVTQANPDVRYYNALHNGYIDLTFNRKIARANLVTVDTVHSRDYSAGPAARFTVRPSGGSLKFTAPKGLNLKQRALFSGLG